MDKRTTYALHLFLNPLLNLCLVFSSPAKQSGFFQALLLDYAFHTSIFLISLLNSFQLVCMSFEACFLKLDSDPCSRPLLVRRIIFPVYIHGSCFCIMTESHILLLPWHYWFMAKLWIAMVSKIFLHRIAVYEESKDAVIKTCVYFGWGFDCSTLLMAVV